MDLTTTGSTPTNTNTTDTENETPPAISTIDQPIKSLTFTNGALKKHSLHHHRLYPQPPSAVYKECLKNHAASMGGHALDGCGEFMPSPASNPTDPTSLKCAACGCHRNFHRRREEEPNTISFHLPLPPPPPRRGSPLSSPSPPPQPQSAYYSSAPAHMLLALSTAVREEQHNHAVATPETPTAAKAENPSGRKRFRTKFSREQKEKMFLFSEKIGWKMQKSDQGSIEEFCNKIGVSKGVLKVWMHNNKNTFAKKDVNSAINSNNFSNFDGKVVLKFENNGHSNGGHIHVSANGSSSSA